MFVEIRKNKKFYLVHSFREGKRILKIRRYLGHNLSKEQLLEKRKKAEKYIKEQFRQYREIRDPLKTVLSKNELKQIEKLNLRKLPKIFHLNKLQWSRFSELFSYNTNVIEGSTLTQKEVTQLIRKNKLPKKNEKDIDEAKGVVEAINFIRKTREHISLGLIKRLHYIVFKKTKPFAGQFRREGIDVVITDGYGNIVHRGAPSHKIEGLLNELTKWYNKNKTKYHPILLAAVVHNQFENIHPFQDGNGRVGRLLMNNILLKHKMPPVNIEFKRRQEYYGVLQEYEKRGNIRPTIEFMLKEYKELKRQLEKLKH